MNYDIHIIGGGLAGSKRPGSSPKPGSRSASPKCAAAVSMTPAHHTDRLAENGLLQQLSLRRCGEQCGRLAPPGDAGAGLADPALRRTSIACRPARRWRSTVRDSPPGLPRAIAAHPHDRGGARAGRRTARERPRPLSPTRPAHRARAGRSHCRGHRLGTPSRFFDAIAPDRPSRQHRHGDLLDGGAAGTRATARITSTARWTRSNIWPSSPRLLNEARRPSSASGSSDTPYFEGCMPIEVMAERGVDTMRYGPMKACWARRPAHRALALCGGAAAAGQCARHAVEHRRLPDQAEACRAGPRLPHHSRP